MVLADTTVSWPVDALANDAQLLLDHLERSDAELSLTLVDDDAIGGLNATWRGKSGPTDVLSFPQGGAVLGDVVISVDTAKRQADGLGHDLPTELRVLLVHGLCHLLGHDHYEPEETAAMVRAEGELLAVLGLEVRDCNSGFRSWRRAALVTVRVHATRARGPAIVQELLFKAHRQGVGIAEVPIQFHCRAHGRSTLTLGTLGHSYLAVLHLRWLALRGRL